MMLNHKFQHKYQIHKMGWICNWTRLSSGFLPLFLYISLIILPSINTSNNACDWTGSGLSNQHQDREIVSIDLRCSAGKIVWNYPRGAIRIILRSNIRSPNSEKGFRACLKVHKTPTNDILRRDTDDIKNQTLAKSDLIKSNQIARIFLEAPKRLIALYDDVNDKQMVKCFRSIGGQVALYVEADKTPFEIMQTTFEYNLEFINNKRHSIQTQVLKNDKISNDGSDSLKMNSAKYESDSWWLWWRNWLYNGSDDDSKSSDGTDKFLNRRNGGVQYDEDIVSSFGESWDVCRPCSEEEMIHAYCSSDIVTRGTIFSIQQQQSLDTVEITIRRTKILRNNMQAIRNAEDAWRRHYKDLKFKTKKHRRKLPISNDANENEIDSDEFKFHTPTHCQPSHGDGEFVFIGRKRFDEVMLICAPRLEEWAHLSRKMNESNTAPCILLS